MICLYLLYRYRELTAKQALAWLRLCRPGSVVGKQQYFIEEMAPKIHDLINSQHVVDRRPADLQTPKKSSERASSLKP